MKRTIKYLSYFLIIQLFFSCDTGHGLKVLVQKAINDEFIFITNNEKKLLFNINLTLNSNFELTLTDVVLAPGERIRVATFRFQDNQKRGFDYRIKKFERLKIVAHVGNKGEAYDYKWNVVGFN